MSGTSEVAGLVSARNYAGPRRSVLERGWCRVRRSCAIIRRPCTTGDSVGAWRSLVARIVRDDEVGGSNPLAPTIPKLARPPGWDRSHHRDPANASSNVPRRGYEPLVNV